MSHISSNVVVNILPQKRLQTVFLLFFIIVNAALILFAVDKEIETSDGRKYSLNATYAHASDGQRYWGTAISLAKTGQFLMRDDETIHHADNSLPPLSRSGPVPAILFAVPIRLLGFENAVVGIIAGQCFLLFVMSLAARGIAQPFQANKNLVQGLVLFNPNLIGHAHHAQSDLIFAFIFTLLLLIMSKLIDKPSSFRLSTAIAIGVLAGLLPLTRPMGVYCILFLPIFVLIALWFRQRFVRINWLHLLKLTFISATLTLTILMPWATRNYVVFGDFGLVQSGAIQSRYYYRTLRAYGMPESTKAVEMYLLERGYDPSCIDSGEPGSGCEKAVRNAYMNLILSAPKTILAKAGTAAIAKTLLSGGTSTITKYLGLHPTEGNYNIQEQLNWESLKEFLAKMHQQIPPYLLLFLLITAFPLATRGLGLIGIIRAISTPASHGHLIFHTLMIILLITMYGLQGWSRFRVPMEPILMIFAAIALSKLESPAKKLAIKKN